MIKILKLVGQPDVIAEVCGHNEHYMCLKHPMIFHPMKAQSDKIAVEFVPFLFCKEMLSGETIDINAKTVIAMGEPLQDLINSYWDAVAKMRSEVRNQKKLLNE